MKTRKETNAEFIQLINGENVNNSVLLDAVRFNQRCEVKDVASIKLTINDEYSKNTDSWDVNRIANEYNKLVNMTRSNYLIWRKYRINGNQYEPIVHSNGEFVDSSFVNMIINLDGEHYTITENGVSTENNNYIPTAHMKKLIQIQEHLFDIKRIVE